MATTAGSTFPMVALHASGQGAVKMTVVPLEASEVVTDGDIIRLNSTSRDAEVINTAAADGTIFGIAKIGGTQTAAATIDRTKPPGPDVDGVEHVLNVQLALPGTVFSGNIIDTGINDHTGVYQDDLRLGLETLESTEGFACIEDATAASQLFTLHYMSPQYLGTSGPWQHGRLAGVGIANPRVAFMFESLATVFGDT